jgi:hypothetical protein
MARDDGKNPSLLVLPFNWWHPAGLNYGRPCHFQLFELTIKNWLNKLFSHSTWQFKFPVTTASVMLNQPESKWFP